MGSDVRIQKNCLALAALVVCLLIPGLAVADIPAEIAVNKSILLNLKKPSARVSIANPAIAELVAISPTQLQLIGMKIGTTSLIVWEKGGGTSFFDIKVVRNIDLDLLEAKIKEIAPADSITVEKVNDTIVLGGKATNDRIIAKAVLLASSFAARFKERDDSPAGSATPQKAEPGSSTQQPAILPFAITGGSSDSGTAGSGSDPGGSNRSGMDKVSVDRLVQMTPGIQDGAYKIINLIQVDTPQQVLLEIKVAQVDKQALESLGVSLLVKGSSGEGFSNLVGAPDAGNKDGSNIAPGISANQPWMGAIAPLAPYQLGGALYKAGVGGVLKALAQKELAKILAEPNLLVKSGQDGNFFSGKKFYYPVVTQNSTDLKEVTVGVKLKFRPEVLENGLIKLKIDPAEVSAITGNLVVNNATTPIIDSRDIRTEVQLKDGESLVMGGLIQEETIKSMSKIPLLGDIPILGALFRSTQDDLIKKELVFFITPKLVKANAPNSKTELPTDRQLTPEQERELKWLPLVN